MTKSQSQSQSHSQSNHVDKRTGIVYTNLAVNPTMPKPTQPTQQSHLDAFLPAAFLKTYFDGESKI